MTGFPPGKIGTDACWGCVMGTFPWGASTGIPFTALVGRDTGTLPGAWNTGVPAVTGATETPGVTPCGVTTEGPGV